jgi:predicted DNA binding protein
MTSNVHWECDLYRVILEVRPPSSWTLDVASKHNVPIVILDCIPHGSKGAQGLIEVDVEGEVRENVISSLAEHPDILALELSNNTDGRMLATVLAKNWVACSTILKSDCFLRGARTRGGEVVEWRLLVRDEGSLAVLRQELELAGCQVRMRSKTLVKEPYALTARQEQVVRKALELGYYDFPRRITARDLSKKLGIAASTVSEILQRSERKLVEFYLRNRV